MCRDAALPTNTPSIPCILDPCGRAGICGDWLLGSSLESAALSGRLLPIILQIIYEVVEFVLRSLVLVYKQVFCHSKDMILGNSWVQMEKEEVQAYQPNI